MAEVILNEFSEVRLVSYSPPQIGLNVLHYQCIALSPAAAIPYKAVASRLDVLVHAAYKACMSSTASWRGVGIRPIRTPVVIEEFETANDGGGTDLASIAPRQLCGILTKRTALVGRGFRGRLYVAFPSQNAYTVVGAATVAYVASLDALAGVLLNNFVVAVGADTATFSPRLRHRVAGPPVAFQYIPLTNIKARDKMGTQRRRGAFGAANALPW